jgi:enoyl-CoA hydratase/carnithine racemase
MDEIITERSGGVLRVELNRPAEKNAMTSRMYVTLATASETARKLAAKPPGAFQASKRLLKRSFREQIKTAMKAEDEEFSVQVRSEDAKEVFTAFVERRQPRFGGALKSSATA